MHIPYQHQGTTCRPKVQREEDNGDDAECEKTIACHSEWKQSTNDRRVHLTLISVRRNAGADRDVMNCLPRQGYKRFQTAMQCLNVIPVHNQDCPRAVQSPASCLARSVGG